MKDERIENIESGFIYLMKSIEHLEKGGLTPNNKSIKILYHTAKGIYDIIEQKDDLNHKDDEELDNILKEIQELEI